MQPLKPKHIFVYWKGDEHMLETQFGIEIEMTGITRAQAANIAADLLGGTAHTGNRCYATDARGRRWNFVYDGSIKRQKKAGRQIVSADGEYSVEMVSPILTYREDIPILQELVRRLRKHIHRSIENGERGTLILAILSLCGYAYHCLDIKAWNRFVAVMATASLILAMVVG
jgi:hypothetical protein